MPANTEVCTLTTSSGFRDGLGERVLAFDRASGEPRERLRVRPELGAFEAALGAQIDRVSGVTDPRFPRARDVDRDRGTGQVVVVSDYAQGERLSDLLASARAAGVFPDISAALQTAGELLLAMAAFSGTTKTPHGAIAPSRIVISDAGDVVLTDYLYAPILARLHFSPARLWNELEIAAGAGGPTIDEASDVRQIALVLIAMALGRPIERHEYPASVASLVSEVCDVAMISGGESLAGPLRAWLERALNLEARLVFGNAAHACASFGQLMFDGGGLAGSRSALLGFLHELRSQPEIIEPPLVPFVPPPAPPVVIERQTAPSPIEIPAPIESPPVVESAYSAYSAAEEPPAAEEPRVIAAAPIAQETPAIESAYSAWSAAEEPPPVEATRVVETPIVEEVALPIDAVAAVQETAVVEEPATVEEIFEDIVQTAEALGRPAEAPPAPEYAWIEPAPVEPIEAVEAQPIAPPPVEQAPAAVPKRKGFFERIFGRSPEPVPERPVFEPLVRPAVAAPVEPVEQAPIEPVIHAPAEHVFTPIEPVVETPVEPIVQAPVEPQFYTPMEGGPLRSAVQPPFHPPVEPAPRSGYEPFVPPPVAPAAPTWREPAVPSSDWSEWDVDEPESAAAAPAPPPAARPLAPEPLTPPPLAAAAPVAATPEPKQGRDSKKKKKKRDKEQPTAAPPAPPARPFVEVVSAQPGMVLPEIRPPGVVPLPPPSPPAPLGPSSIALPEIAPPGVVPLPPPMPPAGFAPMPPSAAPISARSSPLTSAAPGPIRLKDAQPDITPRRERRGESRQVSFSAKVETAEHAAAGPAYAEGFTTRPARRTRGGFGTFFKIAAAIAVLAAAGFAATKVGWSNASAEPGVLTVESTPAGSDVYIDGTLKGKTPLTIPIPAGPHEVKLARGRATHTVPVTIEAGKQRIERLAWSKIRQAGGLRVSSQPPGAKVYVDGALQGETPLELPNLAAGRHTVSIQGSGGSIKRTVRVTAGEQAVLEVELYSGFLRVFAPVELQLSEKGRLLGTSGSDQIILPAGRHEVVADNASLGYRETHTVEIEAGETKTLSLEPTGSLSINAVPWAEVWIEGTKIGETPIANRSVPIGTREIVFRHPQLGERRVVTIVKYGEVTTVTADFTKP